MGCILKGEGSGYLGVQFEHGHALAIFMDICAWYNYSGIVLYNEAPRWVLVFIRSVSRVLECEMRRL
jgi:hypothetical protein